MSQPSDFAVNFEKTLPDGTTVTVRRPGVSRTQIHLQELDAPIGRLNLSEKFDSSQISTVEDLFNVLMNEVTDMHHLAQGLLAFQNGCLERLNALEERYRSAMEEIRESDMTLKKMVAHAADGVDTFEHRLRGLNHAFVWLRAKFALPVNNIGPTVQPTTNIGSTPSFVPPRPREPNFLPPGMQANDPNLQVFVRIMGTNWLKDGRVDDNFPQIQARAAEKLRLQEILQEQAAKFKTDSAVAAVSSQAGEGTPLSALHKDHLNNVVHLHNEARQVLSAAHQSAKGLKNQINQRETDLDSWVGQRWMDNEDTLGLTVYVGRVLQALNPHLQQTTAKVDKALSAASFTMPPRTSAPPPRMPPPRMPPPRMPTALAEAGPGPSTLSFQKGKGRAITPPADGDVNDNPEGPTYRMTLSIASDKPVKDLTIAELSQVLDSFPLRVNFNPKDLKKTSFDTAREWKAEADAKDLSATTPSDTNMQVEVQVDEELSGSHSSRALQGDEEPSQPETADRSKKRRRLSSEESNATEELATDEPVPGPSTSPAEDVPGDVLESTSGSRTEGRRSKRQKSAHVEEKPSSPAADMMSSRSRKRGRESLEPHATGSAKEDDGSSKKKRRTR